MLVLPRGSKALLVPFLGVITTTLVLSGCSSNAGSNNAAGGSGTTSNGSSSSSGSAIKINTADCTDPAAATKKITGTFKIGYSLPLSGPVAGAVVFNLDGFKARIAAQNAAGGIDGVKIDVIYRDDAYTPDKAKANVTQFLEQDHVDAVTTFGSGPVGAMADDQNAACVPMLYPSSGEPEYGKISQYPWTTQYLPPTDLEAKYEVSEMLKKFPNGARVGVAVDPTEPVYSQAFQAAAKGTKIDVVKVTPSTDPNAAATALKSANADVVFIAGITNDCGPDTQALARIGYHPKMIIAPSNCANQTYWAQAGQAASGVIVPTWVKNPADPALATDPGVKQYLSEVKTSDKDNNITVLGWTEADLMVNTLKQAAASASGLTHLGVIEAARDQSYACPMFITGIKWISTPNKLVGPGSFQTQAWDAATKSFTNVGSPISVQS